MTSPRSRLPFGIFVIAIALANLVLLALMESMLFSIWIGLGIQVFVVGEIITVMVLAGLMGRCWIAGLVVASSILFLWVSSFVLGLSWNTSFFGNDPRYFVYFLLAPLLILGGAIPFYVARMFFGWRLSRDLNEFAGTRRFGIGELLSATVVVASLLFLCRVPSILLEIPQWFAWGILGVYCLVGAIVNLAVGVPMVYIVFRVKSRIGRFKGYIGVLFFFLFVVSILSYFASGPSWESIIFASCMIPVWLGLTALKWSGYQLGQFPRGNDVQTEQTDNIDTTRSDWSHVRWAAGVFVFSLATSFALSIQSQSYENADRSNLALLQAMKQAGSSIDVRGHEIVTLSFGPETTNEEFNNFATIDSVQEISLANTKITDAAILHLNDFPNLISLDLSHTKITVEGLKKLRRLRNLSHLSLARTNLTLPEIAEIPALKNCRSLDLSGLKITDELLSLEHPVNRRSLILRDNLITDLGVANLLKSFGYMHNLDLSGNQLTGTTLTGLNSANTLVLENVPLKDSQFGPIASNISTQHMVLKNTDLTDAVLPSFGKTVGFGIEFGDGNITEEGLAKNGFEISELGLTSKQFTGKCFETWHPYLRKLNLSGSGVNDDTIKHLANLRSLSSLFLANTEISDSGLKHIETLPLIQLDLSNTRVTANGLLETNFMVLSTLNVAIGQFTYEEVQAIKRKYPLAVGKKTEE